MRKLLLEAHCHTNEWCELQFLYIELDTEDIRQINTIKDKVLTALEGLPAESWGSITLPTVVNFEGFSITPENIKPIPEGETWVEQAADFNADELPQSRLEMKAMLFYPDGTVWLKTREKHCSDEIEAQLPEEVLRIIMPLCEACGGKGWLCDVSQMTPEKQKRLNGIIVAPIERCDACEKYAGDLEAARAFFADPDNHMFSLDEIKIKLTP